MIPHPKQRNRITILCGKVLQEKKGVGYLGPHLIFKYVK